MDIAYCIWSVRDFYYKRWRSTGHSQQNQEGAGDVTWDGVHWQTQPSGWDSVQEQLCHIWVRSTQLPMEDTTEGGWEQQG